MRNQTANLALLRGDLVSEQVEAVWQDLCAEAVAASAADATLSRAMNAAILYHGSFAQALGHRIAQKPAARQAVAHTG
ncbi:MAG: hypothetical protein P4M00_12710 [Azospirillaceae bacterium]|nr:hypothetical protein [Azospirillaceae bacterium]